MELLILGASARAAAHSARRAGLRPAGIDLFADLDLQTAAPFTRRVDRHAFPDGLERLAAEAPPSPWLYTGALENHPDLVDRIARARPLWGNPGPALRAVRDPIAVADALRRAGLPHPAVRLDPAGLPRDGSWLLKPLASAGGRRIRPWLAVEPGAPADSGSSVTPGWLGSRLRDPGVGIESPNRVVDPCAGVSSSRPQPPRRPETAGAAGSTEPRSFYYQERVAGPSLAAIFAGWRADATLLGVTHQWIGGPEGDFTYRGSIGPWPLAGPEWAAVERLGRALASAFGLAGLFGVDFLLRDGLPWPVEVNPRYTASVEVLELALGRPFLVEHARAFDAGLAGRLRPAPPPPSRPAFVGKAYLFAPATGRFPGAPNRLRPRPRSGVPHCADIPPAGQPVAEGEPVLTVFARGATPEDCGRRLRGRLAAWSRRLARAGAG